MTEIAVRNRGTVAADTLEETGDADLTADIVRRRIEGASPFSSGGSLRVPFKRPDIVGHWFNAAKGDDHIWRQRTAGGWQAVTPDMIENFDEFGGMDVQNGEVVRGERGTEHLMWMTKDHASQIATAKIRANDKGLGSSSQEKAELAETAGQFLGDQAGEFIEKQTFGEIHDSVERIPIDE